VKLSQTLLKNFNQKRDKRVVELKSFQNLKASNLIQCYSKYTQNGEKNDWQNRVIKAIEWQPKQNEIKSN